MKYNIRLLHCGKKKGGKGGGQLLPVLPRLQLILGRNVLTRASCLRRASGSIRFTPFEIPIARESLAPSGALILDCCAHVPSSKEVDAVCFALLLLLLRPSFLFRGLFVALFLGGLEL